MVQNNSICCWRESFLRSRWGGYVLGGPSHSSCNQDVISCEQDGQDKEETEQGASEISQLLWTLNVEMEGDLGV